MRFPIRAQLLGAFAIDLLLFVALGFFASQQMSLMNARANSVANHTIPSLNIVATLKTQVNEYRANQLEFMLFTSSADKERSLARLDEVAARMAGSLEAYRPLISSSAEAEHFRTVEQAWQTLVTTTHQSFIPDAIQNNTGTVRPFYSRMNPIYSELEAGIARLAAESQLQAADSLDVVQRAYDRAQTFILADTLLTLVVSAIIGLVLSGRIANRIGRLTGAANKVAAGDLEAPVTATGRDELGQLAHAFNAMVASLRAQRQTLEERNDALQISLARQEQLTADLTDRTQAEEQAHRAQAAAEAASQAKTMFLATMSHELRTPLNAILGYAQLMRLTRGTRTTNELQVDPLDRILAAGRHLTTLINNVLDFAKIEQGKIELTLSDVAVATIAHEAADVVAPLVQGQGNALYLECEADLDTMHTDAGKVRQILINLLSNAAKFTENGVITLRITREAQASGEEAKQQLPPYLPPPAAYLRFEVSDTGIGIAPEDLGRLFQPFSQVDPSVTRRYEGTGMGLALSRQLCLVLGGDISVTSEPGRGSTFTVHLPVKAPAAQPAATPLLVAV